MSLLLILHFNSIKVRLKLVSILLMLICHLFQFHKGTIKTFNDQPLKFYDTVLFQFHKGTIKTKYGGVVPSNEKFQFHKGTIKT